MSSQSNLLSQLDLSIIAAKEATPAVQEYVNNHIVELGQENIVPEIQAIARAMNLPQGFIDGVKCYRSGKNRIKIVNDWGSNEKPLAKWFNYGTRDHGPVKALFLSWISKITGKRIFAKWVRGVPRTNAMEIGIELGKKRFIQTVLLRSYDHVTKRFNLIE